MPAEARQVVRTSLPETMSLQLSGLPFQSTINEALAAESNEEDTPALVIDPPRGERPTDESGNPGVSAGTRDASHANFSNVDAKPVVLPITAAPPRPRFRPLQMFEGTVTEPLQNRFRARLRNVTDPYEPDHEATISHDDIWESDRDLIRPGAIFYWAIGYLIEASGKRSVKSNFRFRRLPAWTAAEIEHIEEESVLYDRFFDDDD